MSLPLCQQKSGETPLTVKLLLYTQYKRNLVTLQIWVNRQGEMSATVTC